MVVVYIITDESIARLVGRRDQDGKRNSFQTGLGG